MALITYFIKVNLVFTVIVAIYMFGLRGETSFLLRRLWLLFGAVIALLLPLLPTGSVGTPVIDVLLPAVTIAPAAPSAHTGAVFVWFVPLHLGISAVLLGRVVLRTMRAVRDLRQEEGEASSFFRLVRAPMHVSGVDREAMIAHERVHVSHGHSFDVLFFEVLAALFWSNPVWRLALRELRLVHEHTADAVARLVHADYDGLLLAAAIGAPAHSLINPFGSSNLKTRIVMLHNTRPSRLGRRKLLLAVPALALGFVLVSWQAVPFRPGSVRSLARLTTVGGDHQPEFPGGMEALMAFLSTNLRYPDAAEREGVEGKVFVGFTVKADGSIADVKVQRGVRADLDAESVRVVRSMPNWEPAVVKGKPADAAMTIPIMFTMTK